MIGRLKQIRQTIPLVTQFLQRSEIAEQYRVIGTRIIAEITSRPIKSLLITSAQEGEGKSTVAANLAVILADSGRKVLLVDADLRTGGLTRGLGLNNEDGLSKLLRDQEAAAIVAQALPETHVWLLASGPTLLQVSAQLTAEKISVLLEKMETVYDLIIFDAPAICGVPDAQILAKQVAGTILIINEKIATVQQVKQAQEIITSVQGKLIGAIVNSAER